MQPWRWWPFLGAARRPRLQPTPVPITTHAGGETLLAQETAKLSAFNVAEELPQTKLADLTAAKRIREPVIDQLGTKGDDLTACDIRAFASAVESCRRVARLALRVNTEGV